jgi:serine/threonine protein kinase
MVFNPGQKISNGQYTIERELGTGGLGITYLAKDIDEKEWAIKTLKVSQNHSNFEHLQNQFIDEGKILSRFKHHFHIVKYEGFVVEGDLWCMVMEYVEGKSLDKIIREEGVLDEKLAIDYIQQIADALEEVHKQNHLHRDVKPENIMKRNHGNEVVLIDFGIARELLSPLTTAYTDGYSPIEQYISKLPKGKYTDVYALAATLYVLLTGYTTGRTHLVKSLDRDLEIKKNKPDPLKNPNKINQNISLWVSNAIMKGMSVNHEDRPQNVTEWLKLLKPPDPDLDNTDLDNTVVVGIRSFINTTFTYFPYKLIAINTTFIKWSLLLIFLVILYYLNPNMKGPISVRNIDLHLTELEKLLKNQKFEDADQKTLQALRFLTNREGQSFTKESIDKIRCDDLRAIDQLWQKYSEKKFGFSIQSKIWKQLGGQPGIFDEKIVDTFAQEVKWRVNGKLYGGKPNYTFSAPSGHLPFLVPTSTRKFGIPYIAERIENCKID